MEVDSSQRGDTYDSSSKRRKARKSPTNEDQKGQGGGPPKYAPYPPSQPHYGHPYGMQPGPPPPHMPPQQYHMQHPQMWQQSQPPPAPYGGGQPWQQQRQQQHMGIFRQPQQQQGGQGNWYPQQPPPPSSSPNHHPSPSPGQRSKGTSPPNGSDSNTTPRPSPSPTQQMQQWPQQQSYYPQQQPWGHGGHMMMPHQQGPPPMMPHSGPPQMMPQHMVPGQPPMQPSPPLRPQSTTPTGPKMWGNGSTGGARSPTMNGADPSMSNGMGRHPYNPSPVLDHSGDMMCKPTMGEDSSLAPSDTDRYKRQEDRDKGRGSYRCGRCGVPKKGHVCPYQPKLKRRPEEPPPEMKEISTQVEMDEHMILRRLNMEIQGFPETYISEPSDMVGAEPHPAPTASTSSSRSLHHPPDISPGPPTTRVPDTPSMSALGPVMLPPTSPGVLGPTMVGSEMERHSKVARC